MKIVCVIPCYKRIQISVEIIKLLQNQILVPTVLVIGEDHEEQIATETGARFIRYPNTSLSNKWQMGINYAKYLNPDAILILGSDTCITSNWISYCMDRLENGIDVIGKRDWYLCNLKPYRYPEVMHQCYTMIREDFIGGGRMISRRLLDRMNWILYPKDRDRGLDYQSNNMMKKFNPIYEVIESDDYKVMDVKGPWCSINTFEMLTHTKTETIHRLDFSPNPSITHWLSSNFEGILDSIKLCVPEVIL